MQLDVRTLLIAVAMATAFSAAARIILWRLHPSMPGLLHWAWASVMGAVSLTLIAQNDQFLGPFALSLAQILIAVGYTLAWDGFRRFLDRPPLTLAILILLATAVILPPLILGARDLLPVRSAINTTLVATISGLIARELFKAVTERHVALRITAWVYGANAVFFMIRCVWVLQDSQPAGPLLSGTSSVLTLLWWLGMTLAVTLCMILMAGERLQLDLNDQVSRDPLTGVLNRRAFAMLAEREIGQARRSLEPLAALMMDLDHFKQINDRCGHAFGDEALRRFSAVASRALRQGDVFCRFGGEEFVALLPDSTAVVAVAVAERVREAYGRESLSLDRSFGGVPHPPLTVSIGVTAFRDDDSLESLLSRADAALYRAKDCGRDRTELG